MVVLGGRSDPDEFSSDALLYQVNCNTWLLPDLTRESLVLSPGGWDTHVEPARVWGTMTLFRSHSGKLGLISKVPVPSIYLETMELLSFLL